ncbi:TPA: hypothetical protein R8G53_004252 [Citrobacter braakii]|uniref:hypothetical protein n=1 Tax=Citrobacter braakii TaxID=57706 RepID=UPI00295C707A|nr:hypothetical protein [Citrobacter braakii]HEF0004104.1 hypothetical protein [Citrobacter braakii]HEF0034574.1 hypothetical protein [Citrobacter braakii]
MEHQSKTIKVALFRGELDEMTLSNSLVIPRSLRKWVNSEELKSEPVFIDGDDLVFRSTDGSVEILRLDLIQLLSDNYGRMKERAIGISIDNRLYLARCVREKARELGITLMSKDDWDDIFNVMVRPHRSQKAVPNELDA